MKLSSRSLLIATILGISAFNIGCSKQHQTDGAANAQKPPETIVDVQEVVLQSIPVDKILAGRVTAYETANVIPQASGIIDEVLFQEGSVVSKGQPLYRLNVDNYASAVASAQAAVAQAQANQETANAAYTSAQAAVASQQATLAQAQADLNRLKGLVESNAISKQQYEQAMTAVKTAQATLNSSQAAVSQAAAGIKSAAAGVETAKAGLNANMLNLNRTVVRSPISGKTDRSNVTVGALVASGQATPLVTISRLDPIFIDISQSSSELLRLRQQISTGASSQGSADVQLVLEDGTAYPMHGKLALSEAKVDKNTGAVTLRAVFPNPDGVLLPGMYVNARVSQSIINNATLLPQSAVIRNNKGETQVYVVGKDNKVQLRPVSIDGTYQGKWVASSGLKAGENVIILGGSKVKPGQVVKTRKLPNTSAHKDDAPVPENQQKNTASVGLGILKPGASVASTAALTAPNNKEVDNTAKQPVVTKDTQADTSLEKEMADAADSTKPSDSEQKSQK